MSMARKLIKKPHSGWAVPPNLVDFAGSHAAFSWDQARAMLCGMPEGGLNIAHETVDRHAGGKAGQRVAVRCIDAQGNHRDINYLQLRSLTNRFANILDNLGVGKGDRVFSLVSRMPELYIVALGTLKNRSVFSPLFCAFGPDPIKTRLSIGQARVLVTTERLYQTKVKQLRDLLPDLQHVLLISEPGTRSTVAGTLDLHSLMDAASDEFTIEYTDPEDTALLHFTSGTTGTPKGAIHVHEAVVMHLSTGYSALDLHPQDIFWCTADPGWVTGTSYGIVAPLAIGATLIVDQQEFDAERWCGILEDQKVSVWYTAPTAVRMMMRLGEASVRRHDLSKLRFMASVGEPLNPDAVIWSEKTFGLPFHDNWWQTETGSIMIANYRAMAIKPGSMGRPVPGVEAAIVKRTNSGVRLIERPNTKGELAIRAGWPSMFRGYLNQKQRYRKCFADGWYLSGDLATRDEDGYFWFVGRSDDVIKSAGHLIGPFEVENALLQHAAVAEAGAIGIPDPIAKEIVKAFVVLKPGYSASKSMAKAILGHARRCLGAAVAPREIVFRSNLPRTRSGKIMRRLLKARELGLAEGDLSTLESDESRITANQPEHAGNPLEKP